MTEMSVTQQRETALAMTDLGFLAGPIRTAPYLSEDESLRLQLVHTSLISAFASMVLMDAESNLVNVCEKCERVFVSSSGRAKFCSPRCRKAVMQRNWRAQAKNPVSKKKRAVETTRQLTDESRALPRRNQ